MEFAFGNCGASIYHEIQAEYIRSAEGELLRVVGPARKVIKQEWASIKTQLAACRAQDDATSASQHLEPRFLEVHKTSDSFQEILNLVAYERRRKDNAVVGVILHIKPDTASEHFRKLFVSILLSEMHLQETKKATLIKPIGMQNNSIRSIVDLFDSYLRYSGPQDQWGLTGRRYFEDRVRYFVSREAPLEFCLPAFPCKSSNPDKVAPCGMMPDRGEQLALQRLHDFVRELEAIYDPGAKVWIISDGHVFSDCIGVEDETVDRYSARLIEMNASLCREGEPIRVAFKSLVDLFSLKKTFERGLTSGHRCSIPEINHFLDTRVTEEAELSRRILMTGCQSDRNVLRGRIDSGDQSILALYRGFSKFMLEDLELHPFTKGMSKSQRKKLAIKVSFEMIMRNQAYSNLVELLFPDHIRLSIHAHTNSGPKFGVQLFPKGLCKAIGDLSQCSPSEQCSDLLHIPTPWHNCVIEVDGDGKIYVAKSKAVKEALKSGNYEGGWVEGCARKAGHYKVSHKKEDAVKTNPPPVSQEVGLLSSIPSAIYSLGLFLVCCYVVSNRGFIPGYII